jgi:hypothetical protein
MLTALIMLVLATAAFALIILVVVVIAIWQETHSAKLDSVAPPPMAAVVRRVLGVGVRRPDAPADSTGNQEEPAIAWTGTTRPPAERR